MRRLPHPLRVRQSVPRAANCAGPWRRAPGSWRARGYVVPGIPHAAYAKILLAGCNKHSAPSQAASIPTIQVRRWPAARKSEIFRPLEVNFLCPAYFPNTPARRGCRSLRQNRAMSGQRKPRVKVWIIANRLNPAIDEISSFLAILMKRISFNSAAG